MRAVKVVVAPKRCRWNPAASRSEANLENLLGVDHHHDGYVCVLCEVVIRIAHVGAEYEIVHDHHGEA